MIDWLSWTVQGQPVAPARVADFITEYALDALLEQGVSPIPPYPPFRNAFGSELFRVQWRNIDEWSSVSITGAGCESVRDGLREHIALVQDQVTRIDIALDFGKYSFDPATLAPKITARSRALITSDNGTTLYIGSRTSDAFVRVYRYNSPHPRAGNTRAEAEFKGAYARRVASEYANNGFSDALKSWIARKSKTEDNPAWEMTSETKPMVMSSDKRPGQDGHYKWLLRVALPAVRQALYRGDISEDDLFVQNPSLDR